MEGNNTYLSSRTASFRRCLLLFVISIVGYNASYAKGGIITTIAGKDTAGYSGDNGPAINAKLYNPYSLCLDKWSNIYIADALNNRVRKISQATGIITTVAGDGNFAYSGDSGLAIHAQLNEPEAVITDTIGNIYIADGNNNRIRKITISTGIITTIAGNGTASNTGDGGLATKAELNGPVGLCIDRVGNIYIADFRNNKIRKVTIATGTITTVAGTGVPGYSGDGGLATSAQLSGASQVFVDSAGNIFIADQFNAAVRKVDAGGIITTIAGNGTQGNTGDSGLAVNAQLGEPTGIFVNAQHDVFINDYMYGVIRKIDGVTGIITTIAGTGVKAFSADSGPATSVALQSSDMFVDDLGTIFIADYENNAVRKIESPLGIEEVSKSKQFGIYPNPARDEVTIHSEAHSAFVMMTICDVSGREIVSNSLSFLQGDARVALSLAPGVYVVRFSGSDGMEEVEKMVVW